MDRRAVEMLPQALTVKAPRLLGVAAFAVLPAFLNDYWIDVFNFAGIYCILGISLNLIVGEVGLFNLGHAAFYAAGAYTTAILSTRFHVPVLWLLPPSAVVAGLIGWLVARPIIHLRGDYLCIVTIGLGEILRIALTNDVFGLTGGPNGILGIPRPVLFGFVIRRPIHFYYLIWAFVAASVFIAARLSNTRIGRAWRYIREDEIAAGAMGINVAHCKLLAFMLGAGLAGLAGNLYAGKMTIISPPSFNFWESVVIFCIVILGGTGSIPGVLVAAVGLTVLPEVFRGFQNARMLIFGASMAAMMVFRPEGLWPSRAWRLEIREEGPAGGSSHVETG